MALDRQTVRKVATLARIRMDDGQLDAYAEKLGNIIKFVEQLDEVNTDGVAPLASPVEKPAPLRADKVTDGHCRDKILANAPEALEGFFVVPKVVE